MLATQLASLRDGANPGVGAALDVVTGFDDALVHGFGRLSEERAAAIVALAGAVAPTPLRERAAEAAQKVAAGSVSDDALAVLAGGRAALFGAVHDALLDRLDTALGRTRAGGKTLSTAPHSPASHSALSHSAGPHAGANSAQPSGGDGSAVPPPVGTAGAPSFGNLLAGVRSWLTEVAVTGWRGVDHDLVSAADQTIEAVLVRPELRRLAVLLDGLAAELRASCPIATMERLPARRWADLWTRAMLLAHNGDWSGDRSGTPRGGPEERTASVEGAVEGAAESRPAAARVVSGRLLILGIDVHEHATALQVQVHGVLEAVGEERPRLVRTSVTAAKVDTIVGPAMWQLLRGYPVLLAALGRHRTLDVTDMPLLASGDLVWHDDRAEAGEPADPFATARVQLADALAPAVSPLDRHPVRIAEPVLVEGYTTAVDSEGDGDGSTVTFGLGGTGEAAALTVDVRRLPTCGPLTRELVAGSSACLGLLRWDGDRWSLQPLAIQKTVKKKTTLIHNGGWAPGSGDPKAVPAEPKTGDAVAVLRERAGRLLRR